MTNQIPERSPFGDFGSLNKTMQNLTNTSAGKKAQELDAADGEKDGKISAAVWNAYAKEHGGNTIKNEIDVVDAMNSITKYSVEEQIKAKKERAKELKDADADASASLKEAGAERDVESGKKSFGLE